jgi:hypothetical protein
MTGIDPSDLVVPMIMTVVATMFASLGALLAPGAPDHPQRHGDDDGRRGQLEPRLGGVQVEVAAKVQASQPNGPDDRRVRRRGRQPQQDRLPDRAAHRDDEGRHHGLGVAGLQAVQRPQQ